TRLATLSLHDALPICGRRAKQMRAGKMMLTAAVFISVCLPAFAQSQRIMSGSAGGKKYQFFYDTFLDPSVPEVKDVGGGTIGGRSEEHTSELQSRVDL